ncbi:MAG: SMP-30/gluconolactonase/LRE family protein, partial [Desulfobacterales bacterium]
MKFLLVFGLALIIVFTSIAFAGDIKVINPKSGFPEGPLWHRDKLFYVEYGSQTVMTWDGKQNQELWRMDGCGPSAIVALPAGDFLVTCYDAGSIARISAEGKTTVEYKQDKEGRGFQGPNDFVADKKGGVYFTASGPWESEPIVGMVFYMNPKGEIMQVADDLHYANGVALSKDGKTLFLAESEASRVIQFKVQPDGSLADRRLFVRVGQVDPDSGSYAYPDGLKVDSKGNLYIGQYSKGRIVVVGPNKKLVKTIDVPSPAAPNLAFGPDEKIVYIMAVDDQSNAPYWGKV